MSNKNFTRLNLIGRKDNVVKQVEVDCSSNLEKLFRQAKVDEIRAKRRANGLEI